MGIEVVIESEEDRGDPYSSNDVVRHVPIGSFEPARPCDQAFASNDPIADHDVFVGAHSA